MTQPPLVTTVATTSIATDTLMPSTASSDGPPSNRRTGGIKGGGGRRRRSRGRGPPRDPRADRPNMQQPQPRISELHIGQAAGAGSRLHAGAPDFVPASVAPTANTGRSRQHHPFRQRPSGPKHHATVAAPVPVSPASSGPTKRRASLLRSAAPDVATRTEEDIANNIYECAICTGQVGRKSRVWSCGTCWMVFHIGCIQKWSKNEGSAATQSQVQEGQPLPPKQWRCPGCNLPQETMPSTYNCWCQKELEPKAIPGLPPHSCGQTCGRKKTFPRPCPHPCDLMCHPGPCPPCAHMGPLQSCFCAKETMARRCLDTNYESGWSCGQTCGDLMPCGKHTCPRPCHEGLCGACGAQVGARCYCGKVNKVMPCNDLEDERESHAWTGQFDCNQTCGRAMDCGKHQCEKTCHPQDCEIPHCPRSPDSVTNCPCGKTTLSDLCQQPRSSCTDAIPNCKKPCGKRLACGHQCQQICHSGICLPCLQTVSIKCRCGRNEFNTVCHQAVNARPHCFRICKVHLNCGRHECGERCCTGERKAADRHHLKRRTKMITPDLAWRLREEIEPEHICTRMCGRMLKCGNHICQNLCHKGPCDSCKEALFEDLSCNCGRTVVRAPLPCGTRQPPCNFPCNQPKECGHPQTVHNCHTDEEACPKCPFLTDKPCMCGKMTLKNQPCWRSDVSCGLVCGRRLKCGSHSCQKLCHRAGDCQDAFSVCQQQCGKAKKSCGHPCEKPCHAPSTCREDRACVFKVMVTCGCQRKKEEVRCNASTGTSVPTERQNSPKCDDECAKLERNRNLAAALRISDDHLDDHVPYSITTLNLYVEDIKWAHAQEELLRAFADEPNERRLRFKPMKANQRAFLLSIAEDFGFDGESMDPEPHRHVVLFKTPRFVAAPMKTLQQAVRVKRAELGLGAAVHSIPNAARSGINVTSLRADQRVHDWNGVLLKTPRFDLVESELQAHIIKAAPTTLFDMHFLDGGDHVVLIPASSPMWKDAHQLSELLETLVARIADEVKTHGLAKEVSLGVFETSDVAEPRLVHSKGDEESISRNSIAGGWSQVAAKGSASARAPVIHPIGQRSVYTVLESRLAEAKKKKKKVEKEDKSFRQAEVVDDWEEEVEKLEEVSKADAETLENCTPGESLGL